MKLLNDRIIDTLTEDLRYKKCKKTKTLNGYCYILSEAIYHLYGKICGYSPYYIYHKNNTHWYLKNKYGTRIDLVANSYKQNPFNYNNERKAAFLTKKPSKRCKVIIERLK